jgi:hypothetical protein
MKSHAGLAQAFQKGVSKETARATRSSQHAADGNSGNSNGWHTLRTFCGCEVFALQLQANALGNTQSVLQEFREFSQLLGIGSATYPPTRW